MSCSRCDGQPQIIAQEIAEALGQMLGPRRRDAKRVNQHGGKGIVHWNATTDETNSGITQEKTLLDWSSSDGDAHEVTIELGRIEAGGGGSFPSASIPSASVVLGVVPPGTIIPAVGLLATLPVPQTRAFLPSGFLTHRSLLTGVVTPGITYASLTPTAFQNLNSPRGNLNIAAGDTLFAPLAYRGRVQVLLGQQAVMEDPFYVDIGRGQRFTATASFVGVTLQALAPPVGYNAGSIALWCGLGHGQARSAAPVVYTQYVDQLAPAGVTNVIIPPRANFLLPLRSSDVNNTVQLDFLDNTGAIIDSLQFGNGAMITPAPLEDAYSINITNQGMATVNYRPCFQLSC